MLKRERQPHYLRHNSQCRQPRRHIFLDTESTMTYHAGVQTQTWQLAVARYYDNDSRKKHSVTSEKEYVDAAQLWEDISAFTRNRSRTVLWAHNLAYDLRISECFYHLPRLGWHLRAVVLDGMACWARWQRGNASLVCTDLTSWVSVPLAKVGTFLGVDQTPFPIDPDDTRGLFKRCAGDVDILARAVLNILGWLQEDDLGNWQLTGAGQSWSAFRHRFMEHKVLVHDDKLALEAERRSIWAGRTECWRHGTVSNERTYEYDLHAAYATISAECELPLTYMGRLPRMRLADFDKWKHTRRILAECTIDTTVPVVPTESDGRILWPVGHFRTVLWDCEIDLARTAGAKVRPHRTYIYTSAPVLRKWANWILPLIDPMNGDVPPLQKRILKQWSRSLIGRFSLRYNEWSAMGRSTEFDLSLSKLIGQKAVKGAKLMQVGHDLLELGKVVEHENSLPQLTGYITAMCRCRLWELIQCAGEQNVYYMDTDSLIVNGAGKQKLDARIASDRAFGLRHKRTIGRLELHGPRTLTVDGSARISGVPKAAERVNRDEFLGEAWEGLGEAIASGRAGSVLVYERSFRLTADDKRRRWLANGDTAPYELKG